MKKKMTNTHEIVKFTNDFARHAEIGLRTAWDFHIFFGVIMQCNSYNGEQAGLRALLSLDYMEEVGKQAGFKRSGGFKQQIKENIDTTLSRNFIRFESDIMYKGEKLPSYHTIYNDITPKEIDGVLFYEFDLNPKMRPHIQDLVNNFLSLKLPKGMRSASTIRWLMMARSHYNKFKHTIKKKGGFVMLKIALDEEKRILSLQGKYAKLKDYRRWVIKPRIEAINNSKMLYIGEPEFLKTGRTITHILYPLRGTKFTEVIDITEQQEDTPPLLNQAKIEFTETAEQTAAPKKKRKGDPTEEDIAKLTFMQLRAFDFLVSKGCFECKAYEAIFKLPSEVFKNYEDNLYRQSWAIFEKGTKYKKKPQSEKAAIFLSWINSEGFMEKHLGELIDNVSEYKKSDGGKQRTVRAEAGKYTHTEYIEKINKKKKTPDHSNNAKSKKGAGMESIGDIMKAKFMNDETAK